MTPGSRLLPHDTGSQTDRCVFVQAVENGMMSMFVQRDDGTRRPCVSEHLELGSVQCPPFGFDSVLDAVVSEGRGAWLHPLSRVQSVRSHAHV